MPLPALHESGTKADYSLARVCAVMWDQALAKSKLTERVKSLRPETKRCMVAWMFHTCAKLVVELDEIQSKEGIVMLWTRRHLSKIKQTADDFTLEACKKAPLTADEVRLLERLRATLGKSLNTPE